MRVTVTLDQEQVREAKEYSGIEGNAALLRAGLKALTERGAARRLLALEGTMPGLENIPRRRPMSECLPDLERQKPAALGHGPVTLEAMNRTVEEMDYEDVIKARDPNAYYSRLALIDPKLSELEQTDSLAYLRRRTRLENMLFARWVEIREQLTPYIEQQMGILVRAVDALMKKEIDPILRDLADKDPEAYLRHIEASGGSAPVHEQSDPQNGR